MNAGIDWTGTPDVPPDDDRTGNYILGSVAVVFEPSCNVDKACAALRTRHNFGQRKEFHGYELTNRRELVFDILNFVVENAMVYGLFWDKRQLRQEDTTFFDDETLLLDAAGLAVFHNAIDETPLLHVWCDEEIKKKDEQKIFNKKLRGIQKSRWGAGRKGPDAKHRKSDKSNLIQLADVVAYVLQRYLRGLKLEPRIRELARQIWGNGKVKWGEGGDLRPYFP